MSNCNIRGDIVLSYTLRKVDLSTIFHRRHCVRPASSHSLLRLSGSVAVPMFLTEMTHCGKWDRRRGVRAELVVYVVKREH